METAKKILLIDVDDHRRDSRVNLLKHAGYTVDVREDHIEAERLDHEGGFDLVIVSVQGDSRRTIQYSDALCRAKPLLPILLLTDMGVFVPPGTLSDSIETGSPEALFRWLRRCLQGVLTYGNFRSRSPDKVFGGCFSEPRENLL